MNGFQVRFEKLTSRTDTIIDRLYKFKLWIKANEVNEEEKEKLRNALHQTKNQIESTEAEIRSLYLVAKRKDRPQLSNFETTKFYSLLLLFDNVAELVEK